MARILVVEDDQSMNEILVSTLREDDHKVESALHGEQAVEVARSGRFDLLITDVRLPGIDGVETFERVKALHPLIRCIVITGYASHDTPIRAIRLHVDDYLFKPFSLKYFLKAIHRVLNQDKEREEKWTLFGNLFKRHGIAAGRRDAKLEGLVSQREEAFRGLFVGIRSGYLTRPTACSLYLGLERLEGRFRKLFHSSDANSLQIAELKEQYVDILEQLALLQAGAQLEGEPDETLPAGQFDPIYTAVKDSDITFGELLYAPLLRKTPDSRFETLHELLELKRKLWPV